MKVLVVDDSAFVRRALRKLLSGAAGVDEVVVAASGDEALAKLDQIRPDLVTLDVDMPGLDGLGTLRAIRARMPTVRVVMLSVLTRHGADATLDALAAGAVDFIDKTRFSMMDLDRLRDEVLERLRPWLGATAGSPVASGRTGAPNVGTPAVSSPSPVRPALDPASFAVCVIGASTGGPSALAHILGQLPGAWPCPLLIGQHMPAGFTASFAARLDGVSRLRVREARDGDRLEPGLVLLAPAGAQTRLGPGQRVCVTATADEPHAPSLDVLMSSVAQAASGRVLGVLLTGMGDDGARGLAEIRRGGGLTLGESAESCVVFGMPRAAMVLGAVEHLLPLQHIAWALAGPGRAPSEGRGRP
jgi:two-component system chemotaxis response regulator CheB